MSEKTGYKKEKMTEAERKKRADLEREIGVPDPPVPNRAHTEMSTRDRTEMSTRGLDDHRLTETASRPFGESAFYVDRFSKKPTAEMRRKMDKE